MSDKKTPEALTVSDLALILKQMKATGKTKVFLSSDEEGNNFYGLSGYSATKNGDIILYPSNSSSYLLSDPE